MKAFLALLLLASCAAPIVPARVVTIARYETRITEKITEKTIEVNCMSPPPVAHLYAWPDPDSLGYRVLSPGMIDDLKADLGLMNDYIQTMHSRCGGAPPEPEYDPLTPYTPSVWSNPYCPSCPPPIW